ncbi:hypothetical protein DL764_009056 [Monosporascus ibericus]|uniref:Serine carboxypeptidase S28 n=1 Tax=Monosporascus ibericus TaxID=155417 RepID=A0A4Q4SYX6_9PEZI|nr:hypothetical protein DL764_009056 [Monosporascus ibericus]
MMVRTVSAVIGLLSLAHGLLQRQPLPIKELAKQIRPARDSIDAKESGFKSTYPEYKLATPIDHFHNESKYEPHSDDKFDLRYWFDDQFYKPGGPVIVLCGGETSGARRLPFLQKGIVYELAKATGGLGVILEHRYYGESIPVDSFSTQDLRFLTTEQALADTAYFANNVKFDGLMDFDLSPESTPWFAYGGSYAGAFVAFLRVVYPDVFWGSISSSGVPAAIWDYWEYFEAARIFGPSACVETTQKVTDLVDQVLGSDDPGPIAQLKEVFGLGGLSHNTDFANVLSRGISGLQGLNWDPAVSSNAFFEYCGNVSAYEALYPAMEERRALIEEFLILAGYKDELEPLATRTLNYIGWLNLTVVSKCDETHDQCFTSYNTTFYEQDDLSQTWRLWMYQVCTEWGYLQTGSGVPPDRLPLVSRAIDLEYTSIVCREAFNMTEPANVENINKYGAFNISHSRLAFVDGEWDPWRAAGVHALTLNERNSSVSEPYILIDGAVHHWDENGLLPNETMPDLPPPPVVYAKKQIKTFVSAWLMEWKSERTSIMIGLTRVILLTGRAGTPTGPSEL